MGCSPSRDGQPQGTKNNVPGMRTSYDTKVEGEGKPDALVDTHRASDVNAENNSSLTKLTTNSSEDDSSVLTNKGDSGGEATPTPDQVLLTMADSYHNRKIDVGHVVIENDVTAKGMKALPDFAYPCAPVDFHCLYGYARAKWPIPCYASLDMSVNAYWGGCAGLVLCSNSYGGKGAETTAEVFLYRAGFSGNYYEVDSMSKSNTGHFGCRNIFTTDENGKLVGDVMFGSNQLAVMTSDPRYGDLQHGVRVAALEGAAEAVLPLDVNGEDGAGNTLVLCSGWEVGSSDAVLVAAVYTVRSGQKDNFQEAKLLCGTDKWSFSLQEQLLKVQGPSKSIYSLYHNRKDKVNTPPQQDATPALAGHVQALSGEAGAVIPISGTNQAGVIVVMCSNSCVQGEEATSTALYLITVGGESKVNASYVKGLVGNDYPHRSADLWAFKECQGGVSVTGPNGPCRYGYFSNVHTSGVGPQSPLHCLATGEETPVQGAADIDTQRVIGWVNKITNIKIIVDKTVQLLIPEAELKEVKPGTYAFAHNWSKEEKRAGLRLVAVVAERRHIQDGTCHDVPLSGSPRSVAWQPPGVIYALNCAGQSYEAADGIIYESEFSKFANFTYDFNWGSQSRALGMVKYNVQAGQLIAGTPDGFMFVQDRTPWAEAVDEKKVNYKVEDLPNGKYTLRLHTVRDTFADLKVNGASVSKTVDPQLQKVNSVVPGCTAHSPVVPVTISNNTLTLTGTGYCLCGFALYDTTFTPKAMTKEEIQIEETVKRQLADSLDPLTRTMTRKARKLVGWSQNLLLNSSAERGDTSGWNIGGDWAIQDGGHGTEKAFVSSHMWCTKHQEVLLTTQFTPEYLDTAPSLQVSEWYREGVCGGGHYYFKAALHDEDGNVIKEHILPPTGRIYNGSKWIQEAVTFKNYGPGVRSVYLESRGKDDKHWGGHYGIWMSAATVRIQREAVIPDDDGFEDIKLAETTEDEKEQVKLRDALVGQLLLENAELLQTMGEDGDLPDSYSRLEHLGSMQRPKQRKKREIRVFVSSTFRDFTLEREELIKKTFREVNQECSKRGVFFTYVDLRWGISEDQTSHGQTIAICLQEIDRCRPYFICLMGQRYGWAQKEDKKDELLDTSFTYAIENFPSKFSWIDQHRQNTSVTMLEVLHGVLNNVDLNKSRSFFYLRNQIQPSEVDAERYARLVAESDWHKDRQDALRRMVEDQPDLNTRRYREPHDVCAKIKKDLLWCLDKDFPRGTELTPLEREREAHIAFADARCRVYIGREDYFTNITDFVNKKTDTPIVIVGESGSGKSALVANWVQRMEETFPTAFIFVHFIGSSAESASYIKLLRRLYEEMKLYYGFQLPVPQSDKDLVGHLSMWLRLAGEVADKPCIIVFDAINQLDSGTGQAGAEHDLLWLPRRLPPGVSLVISTLPGRAMDAVTKAGWAQMKVEPLQESEKVQIVSEYLEGIYGKTLNEQQKGMIVSSKQTNNPLYLKALLDEVRMFGNFRQLTAKIGDYLIAQNPPQLFARILSRFEEDFEMGQHKRPDMVRQMTSAIWCSNKGMSEAELLDLLQIPSAVWSPFYLSVVDNLINRNGILNFFHDHLRQAVEAKYLPTQEDKKKGYLQVADYFSQRPIDSRAAEELPFVLANAGELERLKTAISDLTMFSFLVRTEEGKFDLIKSWNLVGGFSQTEEIYMTQLAKITATDMDPEELTKLKQILAEFFRDLGLFGAARTMLEDLVQTVSEKYKASHSNIIYDALTQRHAYICNHPVLIDLLYTLGSVCEKQKEFDLALEYFTKAIGLQNSINSSATKLQLAEGVLGQATVLYLKQDVKTAKKYLLRARELATEVLGPRHHYVAAIINKLGQLSYNQGLQDTALGFFLHDLRLTRADVGLGHPRVAGIINDVGLVYDDKSDARAGQYYEAALQVLLARYGSNHPDVAVLRFNLGSFYFATFYFSRAKFQFTEALKVFDQFLGADHPDTQEAQNALDDVSAFTDN